MRVLIKRFNRTGFVYGITIWIEPYISDEHRITFYISQDDDAGRISARMDELEIIDSSIDEMKMFINSSPNYIVSFIWNYFESYELFSNLLEGDWEQEELFEKAVSARQNV